MKQKSISILLAMLMSMAANVVMAEGTASKWDEPVAPEKPTQALLDKATAPEYGTSYFILNEGCGQFVTGANSWAVTVSLSTDGMPYMKFLMEDPNDGSENFLIKVDGQYTTYVSGYEGGRSVGNDYVWRDDNQTSAFIDCNGRGKKYWTLTETGVGNSYYWQSAEGQGDISYDVSAHYAAGDAPGKAVIFNKSINDNNITWLFIPADEVDVDAYKIEADAYADAMKIYYARKALYDLLVDANVYGADYAAASAVYNTPDATVEELNAAIDEFKPVVTAALLAYAKKNSTAEEPVDITKYMIVNPNFETRTADGWTVDKIGANCGFQNNAVYANEEEGVLISNFIEAWRPATAQTWTGEPWTIPPYYLLDGKICQTIDALPAGHYILECDGIARNQAPSTDESYVDPDDYKGIYLFFSDGSITVHSTETLKDVESGEFDDDGNPIRVPSHFVFEFDIQDVDSLTIGLMTEDTNMNWMAADNFTLSMAGASQKVPSYVALQGEVNTVEAVLKKINLEEVIAEQAVVDNMKTIYSEAKSLVDAGSDPTKYEVYVAAYTKLIGARSALIASEADYKKASDFLEKLTADHAVYEEKAGYAGVVTAVSNLLDSMQQGYDERTLTSAAITSAIDGYSEMILDAIQVVFNDAVKAGKPLEEGIDITPLFEHMSYVDNNGGNQESFPNGYPAENPVWMNESKTGNFKTNYSTAEVWDARPFNIYREFKGLPKGKYTIKVHALYRVKANSGAQGELEGYNYANYWAGDYDDPDYAWLYANNNKVHLTNVAEMATSANIDGGVEVQNDPHTGGVGYLVNNQSGAYKLFTDPAYAEAANRGYIGVSTKVLEDGGSFTAGIRGTENLEGNHWVTWYNFELYYDGPLPKIYTDATAFSIEADESESVQIGLYNEATNLVAFQMDLTLPEGIGIDKAGCSLSSRITDAEQTLTIGKLENGAYRLTSSSLSLTPISGNLGELVTLKLTAEEGCVGGTATISNIRFSTADSERVTLDDTSFDISVKYDIIYKVDNQDYKTESIAYGADIIPQSDATREGYTFSGWSEIPETMPNHDVVVTGTFSINSYTLTYELDGEVYKSTSVVYGTAITPEEDLIKEGYTFSGWSEIPETMPAKDVTIIGSFTINSYTLTYELDGEVYKSTSVEYGTAITPEEDLIKEGYTFSGWSEIPETMPANDVVVTGSFSVNSYTLTYKVDGEDYKTAIIVYGSPLTPETEPTKEGYTFTGWSEIPETMPAKDVVITGNFYLYGDVNTDTEVDVVDVVDIARYVVGTPSAKFLEKLADLNADDTVNLGDAVVLVNHIAGDQSFVKAMYAPRRAEVSSEVLKLSKYGDNISLKLTTDKAYTAFQLDLVLPEDTDIEQLMLNPKGEQKHQLIYNKLEPGRYRVAVFSPANRTFEDYGDELLSFISESENSMSIIAERIQFFDTLGNGYMFDSVGVEQETGVATLKTGTSAKTDVYDLQGRKFTQPQRGVNIIRSADGTTRKVLVK